MVYSKWRGVVAMAAGWLTAGLSLIAEGTAAPVPVDWPVVREATFSDVWQTVDDSYFDPKFGGVDWLAVRTRYHAGLERAADKGQLRALLQSMLNELHRSHFAILPREAAVYRPSERAKIGTVGVEVAWIDRRVVVTQVGVRSMAAGVRPGDTVVAMGSPPLAAIEAALVRAGLSEARQGFYLCGFVESRLCVPVGTKFELDVEGIEGTRRRVELTSADYPGAWSEPMGAFPSLPIASTMRRQADGVAYLAFNVFSPQLMKGIRGFLLSLNAPAGPDPKPACGLVLDLRGNVGGLSIMGSGIAGWLCGQAASLGSMHLRQGLLNFDVFPQRGAFLGPLAVLIDCRTASTSELMAGGLQATGRARIFGATSAGAALPSAFKTLPTGDILQYAVADLETPHGTMLEGRGVTPDDPVAVTRADVGAKRDPVLAAAEAWVLAQAPGPAGP